MRHVRHGLERVANFADIGNEGLMIRSKAVQHGGEPLFGFEKCLQLRRAKLSHVKRQGAQDPEQHALKEPHRPHPRAKGYGRGREPQNVRSRRQLDGCRVRHEWTDRSRTGRVQRRTPPPAYCGELLVESGGACLRAVPRKDVRSCEFTAPTRFTPVFEDIPHLACSSVEIRIRPMSARGIWFEARRHRNELVRNEKAVLVGHELEIARVRGRDDRFAESHGFGHA